VIEHCQENIFKTIEDHKNLLRDWRNACRSSRDMKRVALILGIGTALGLGPAWAVFSAQIIHLPCHRPSPDPALIWKTLQPNAIEQALVFRASTNGLGRKQLLLLGRQPARKRMALEPGVYKSWPSTAIVVVPDANIDPKMIREPNHGALSMPTGVPDLQLVPLNAGWNR
jgi:hypothetical protein